MKRIAVLIFGQLMVIGCATEPRRAVQTNTPNQAPQASGFVTPTPVIEPAAVPSGTEEERSVPADFAAIDFKNFSYATNLKGKVTLKDGEREFPNPGYLGGATYKLSSVDYADLTGDGKEEAIVALSLLTCGGSCDGGSHLFYFYSAGTRRPRLLSRMETGSLAYGECGLKSFDLKHRNLTLELFQVCRARGPAFKPLPYGGVSDSFESHGKFGARSFTRFLFQFDGRRFGIKQRQILPFTPGDVRGYQPTISVSNN